MRKDWDYREIFVERLRNILVERDMTVKQLASESGVADGTIKTWFNKKKGTGPRADSLAMICDALSVSMDYMFGRSEEL